MRAHDLRIRPASFQAIWDETKTAEFCLDDKFQVRDVLHLHEWDPRGGAPTGRRISAEITHIDDVSGQISGGDPPWVVLSIRVADKRTGLLENRE